MHSRCLLFPEHPAGGSSGPDASCHGACPPLESREWLALKAHYYAPSNGNGTSALRSRFPTVLKKSEALSQLLPPNATQSVGSVLWPSSVLLHLARPVAPFDDEYYVILCAQDNCTMA